MANVLTLYAKDSTASITGLDLQMAVCRATRKVHPVRSDCKELQVKIRLHIAELVNFKFIHAPGTP